MSLCALRTGEVQNRASDTLAPPVEKGLEVRAATKPVAETERARGHWRPAHSIPRPALHSGDDQRPGSARVSWRNFLCQVPQPFAQFRKPDKKNCFVLLERHLPQKKTSLGALFFPATFVTLQLPPPHPHPPPTPPPGQRYGVQVQITASTGYAGLRGGHHCWTLMTLHPALEVFSTETLTGLWLRVALEVKLLSHPWPEQRGLPEAIAHCAFHWAAPSARGFWLPTQL